MRQLTHTPTENPSTNVYGDQQNIYDINIQRQELEKGMLIENTLKGNLNSQQTMNSLCLVITIKVIPKRPIQKLENHKNGLLCRRRQANTTAASRYSAGNPLP